MKILFVLEHFYPYKGGVEFLFHSLGKALIQKGHEVKVVTTWFDRTLPKNDNVDGIDIHRVNCYNRFGFTLLSVASVRKWAKWADAIHTSSYTAAVPAYLGNIGLNKKLFITFHEFWGALWDRLPYLKWHERKLYKRYEKWIAKIPYDKVIAVSHATQKSLIHAGISPDKVQTIYNGIAYDEIESAKKALSDSAANYKDKILFVGRLGVSKGLDLLLPALDIFLAHTDKNVILVIPQRPKGLNDIITREINEMKFVNRIELRHDISRRELYELMHGVAYTIVPSYSEGFGYVALEAQLLGSPVVASAEGSLPEVVLDRHVLMDELSVDALVRALHQADKNEWKYKARPIFKMDDCVDAYLDLYAD